MKNKEMQKIPAFFSPFFHSLHQPVLLGLLCGDDVRLLVVHLGPHEKLGPLHSGLPGPATVSWYHGMTDHSGVSN